MVVMTELPASRGQGFSLFRAFVRYEAVREVHREVRSGSRASTTVLVRSKHNSPRRIALPLRCFDKIKLTPIVTVLSRKLQAHMEDALFIQIDAERSSSENGATTAD